MKMGGIEYRMSSDMLLCAEGGGDLGFDANVTFVCSGGWELDSVARKWRRTDNDGNVCMCVYVCVCMYICMYVCWDKRVGESKGAMWMERGKQGRESRREEI